MLLKFLMWSLFKLTRTVHSHGCPNCCKSTLVTLFLLTQHWTMQIITEKPPVGSNRKKRLWRNYFFSLVSSFFFISLYLFQFIYLRLLWVLFVLILCVFDCLWILILVKKKNNTVTPQRTQQPSLLWVDRQSSKLNFTQLLYANLLLQPITAIPLK